MEPPLDQLIQSLEQITQQLKKLEAVFGSAAKICSQQRDCLRKSAANIEAIALNPNNGFQK